MKVATRCPALDEVARLWHTESWWWRDGSGADEILELIWGSPNQRRYALRPGKQREIRENYFQEISFLSQQLVLTTPTSFNNVVDPDPNLIAGSESE